jgi:integrase/recombinase XerD
LDRAAPRTKARVLSSIKSLLTFAQRIGYTAFNVGAAVRLPRIKNDLAERIMTEEQTLRILSLEPLPRNRVLLRLLYSAGVRVSELAAEADPDDPVFLSRKGRVSPDGTRDLRLTEKQIWRIVRAAAFRAGIDLPVSPHWMRHAHASHALDRGVPPHLVQATLGHASLATTGRYSHAKPSDSSARYLAV